MKILICIFSFTLAFSTPLSLFAAQKQYKSTSFRPSQSIEEPAISEEKCIAEINCIRQAHGLKPLKKWKQLSDCARAHSSNMANGKCPLGHDGFDKRMDQMKKVANMASGENVAYSYNYDKPVSCAVDGWMKSQGHKDNILGDFEETGVGVAVNKKGEFYITQLFAKRFRQD